MFTMLGFELNDRELQKVRTIAKPSTRLWRINAAAIWVTSAHLSL
eukprot:COSAG02_NODE_4579_length_5200_cov_1.998040_4_plen_45_part_00